MSIISKWLANISDVISGRLVNSARSHAGTLARMSRWVNKTDETIEGIKSQMTNNEKHITEAAQSIKTSAALMLSVAVALGASFDALKAKLDANDNVNTEDFTDEFTQLDEATSGLSSAADNLKTVSARLESMASGAPAPSPIPSTGTGVQGQEALSHSGANVDLTAVGGNIESTVPAVPIAGASGPTNPPSADNPHEADQVQPGTQQPVPVESANTDKTLNETVDTPAPVNSTEQNEAALHESANQTADEKNQALEDNSKSDAEIEADNAGGNPAPSAGLGAEQIDGGQLSSPETTEVNGNPMANEVTTPNNVNDFGQDFTNKSDPNGNNFS